MGYRYEKKSIPVNNSWRRKTLQACVQESFAEASPTRTNNVLVHGIGSKDDRISDFVKTIVDFVRLKYLK